jgi:hypothetical protein
VKLPPDWSELIGLLCAERVRFVIVGAHALAVHGRPRATGDLDILVEPTAENARKLKVVLRAFGFPSLARAAARFTEPDRMATLGREPLRIDLMTTISGVSFAAAWKGRVTVRFGRHRVGFLGRAQFLANKRAAGRPKDLLDLALLREAAPRRSGGRRRGTGRRSRS